MQQLAWHRVSSVVLCLVMRSQREEGLVEGEILSRWTFLVPTHTKVRVENGDGGAGQSIWATAMFIHETISYITIERAAVTQGKRIRRARCQRQDVTMSHNNLPNREDGRTQNDSTHLPS